MRRELVIIDKWPDEEELKEILGSLPQWRRDVAMRYKHLAGQRESAMAYVALCKALRDGFGITCQPRFAYNEHGKPYLVDYPNLHFSMSHCATAAGCIVSEQPCGLDIERIRPAKERLVAYTMNEAEQGEIANDANHDLAFTKLWTRKEAVLKLKGTGIATDLKAALLPEALDGIELETKDCGAYVYTLALA